MAGADTGQPNCFRSRQKGKKTGKNPTDRGKLGTKRHNIVDQIGVPLALVLSGANVHDSKEHDHIWDSLIIPRLSPRLVEQHACEDKGYDFPFCRKRLQRKLYVVHIPKRGVHSVKAPRSKRTPSRRRVVERTQRWTNLFRALKIRYARKPVNYEAMAHFANAFVCFRMARSWV